MLWPQHVHPLVLAVAAAQRSGGLCFFRFDSGMDALHALLDNGRAAPCCKTVSCRRQVQNAVHCTDLPEDGVLEVEYFFRLLQT